MKALFVGDFNYLTVSFGAKLAKNGANLAILNESRDKPSIGFNYAKYNSNQSFLSNVYQNFRPEIIIFTAAFDDGNYLDLLENVLDACNEHKIKRFIFLSSSTVYGVAKDNLLPGEDSQINPKSKRALNYSIGEHICKRWAEASETVITTMRISGMYGENTHFATFNRLVQDIIDGETISLNEESIFSFLHIDDACEAFSQIFDTPFSDIYNISSTKTISANELQQLIVNEMPEAKDRIKLSSSVQTECLVSDNSLLKSEYQWIERHDLKNDIKAVLESEKNYISGLKKIKQKQKETEEQDKQPKLLKRIWGYIETILLFLVLVYVTGLQSYVDIIQGVDFTVIYLVVIAIAMTLHQSAFSLLLAIGLLVSKRMQMGYDVFSSIINNQTLFVAAEYCVVSIAVSYIIQRLKTKNQLMRLEMEELERDMKQLQEFSEDNLKTRHFFEDQILEYDLSLPRIISMASRLDALDSEKILPETINIISESINVKDIAVYFIGKRGGRLRLSFAKTHDSAKLGQSPLIDDLDEMISVLEEDEVFVNKTLNEKLPSMASGIKVNGKLTFIFTVWNVPFSKMRQDVSNLFKSITSLVSAAVRRANQYEQITFEQRYLPNTAVMKQQAFKDLCETRLSDDGIGSVLCKIEVPKEEVIDYSKKIENLVRENDYLGTDKDGYLYVLLVSTTVAGYNVFAKRLLDKGIESVQVDGDVL